MAPIVLCLLCLAAAGLWVVHSTTCGIRALIEALTEVLIYVVYVLAAYVVIHLCFGFVMILFTDISIFWDLIVEFFEYLGGFWGIVGIIIGVGILVWLGSIVVSFIAIFGEWLFYVAAFILGAIYVIFEFIEEESRDGYSVVVTRIRDRIVKNQGGSQ